MYNIVQLPINISLEEFLYLETSAFGGSRQVCVGEHQGVEGRGGHPARPHAPHSGKGRKSQTAQSISNLSRVSLEICQVSLEVPRKQ